MWENVKALLVDRVDNGGGDVGWRRARRHQLLDVLDRGSRLRGPLRFGVGVLDRTIPFRLADIRPHPGWAEDRDTYIRATYLKRHLKGLRECHHRVLRHAVH